MEININRISATPRSKYKKYYYGGGGTTINSGGNGSTIDTSNFVRLTGRTDQLIEGNVGATGDIIAYQTSEHDITLPIASTDALGAIKIGSGLTITEDGTLNVTGSTGGSGKAEWGYITGTLSGQTDLWTELSKKANSSDLNIENWDIASDFIVENKEEIEGAITNSHSHDNKEYLDVIDQNLSTVSDVLFGSVKATGDVIAYATGDHDISYPIASSGALGCIMVGSGLTITEEGVLSVTGGSGGGTVSEWGDITGTLSKQTDLWNELSKKANTADLNISNWNAAYNNMHTHSNLSALNNISSTNINNWNAAYNSAHTHSNYNVLSGISSSDISDWNAAYNSAHTHSNKSVLDGISSSDVSSWDTAYNYAHNHSNKSYLDVINQSLSTSSSPTFNKATIGYLTIGDGSGKNCITNNTSPYNVYLNWFSSSDYTVVDSANNIKTTGDVIAYAAGTASAPFKYWRPSVSSSGVLSWTNSTSETTPASVNIKGPAGTNGTNGEDGASLTYQWSGTSLRIGTRKNGVTTWGSYVNLKGADGEDGTGGWQSGTYTDSALVKVINNGNGGLWFCNTSGNVGVKIGGGNGVVGYSSTGQTVGNLYLNWVTSTINVQINNAGKITYVSTGTWSDMRLKNKIESLSNTLDKIDQIDIFYFKWKNGDDKQHIGVSAQQMQELFPELVEETDTTDYEEGSEKYLTVDYQCLNTAGLQAIKELHQITKDQQTEIDQLKVEIENLKSLINDLKNA